MLHLNRNHQTRSIPKSNKKNTYKSQQIRKKIEDSKNKQRKFDNIRRELVERTHHGQKASNFYHPRKPTYNNDDFDRIHEDEKGEYWTIRWGCWAQFYKYSQHPDLGWWFDYGNRGNYAPNLYELNAESIRSYFVQFQTIKKRISTWDFRTASFQDQYKPKYEQYLYNIPKQMQFRSNISRFEEMLREYLEYIFNTKCVDINCNKHTLFCHLKEEIFYFNQNRTFYESINFSKQDRFKCFHCDECTKHRMKTDHFIWDFFCNDFECLIQEIKNNIKVQQQRDLRLIHEFNDKYSKQNCSKYLEDIVDINGISYNICSVILQYLSHEFPIIDNKKCMVKQRTLLQTICGYGLDIISKNDLNITWIDESNMKLFDEKHLYIFSESYCIDEDKIKFCIVGKVGNDMSDKCAYFYYIKDMHKIIFAKKWLLLWNYIDNISIKIGCYAFLFENNDECDGGKNPMLTRWGTLKFTHWNCYYDSLYYSEYS